MVCKDKVLLLAKENGKIWDREENHTEYKGQKYLGSWRRKVKVKVKLRFVAPSTGIAEVTKR